MYKPYGNFFDLVSENLIPKKTAMLPIMSVNECIASAINAIEPNMVPAKNLIIAIKAVTMAEIIAVFSNLFILFPYPSLVIGEPHLGQFCW